MSRSRCGGSVTDRMRLRVGAAAALLWQSCSRAVHRASGKCDAGFHVALVLLMGFHLVSSQPDPVLGACAASKARRDAVRPSPSFLNCPPLSAWRRGFSIVESGTSLRPATSLETCTTAHRVAARDSAHLCFPSPKPAARTTRCHYAAALLNVRASLLAASLL